VRFVLNAGHDGIRDKGAPGALGVPEATINRDVVLAMCGLSDEALTYEPKRQGILGLWTLTRALRANPPDVLVSLHCNAAKHHPPCIHEARIYWWADDPDRERRTRSLGLASAIREHSEGLMSEHAVLCEVPYLHLYPDGTKKPKTPGILVNTAKSAAVLVEMGFISDRCVAGAMNNSWWVGRTASALDAGIRQWIREQPSHES